MKDNTCLNLFVYGSLLEGKHNHHLLTKADAVKTAVARTPAVFAMLDLGSFPGLVHAKEGAGKVILGEVYALNPEAKDPFASFDRLEGHPTFYKREVVRLDDGVTDAWVYVLNDARRESYVRNNPVVESGDWNAHCVARGFT